MWLQTRTKNPTAASEIRGCWGAWLGWIRGWPRTLSSLGLHAHHVGRIEQDVGGDSGQVPAVDGVGTAAQVTSTFTAAVTATDGPAVELLSTPPVRLGVEGIDWTHGQLIFTEEGPGADVVAVQLDGPKRGQVNADAGAERRSRRRWSSFVLVAPQF